MGLEIFTEENFRANTLTVFEQPKGISDFDLRNSMKRTYNVICAGGLGKLKGITNRIGHMGIVSPSDILVTLRSLGASLNRLGVKTETTSPISLAKEELKHLSPKAN
jgi:aspartate aminotransferase-like enzyme